MPRHAGFLVLVAAALLTAVSEVPRPIDHRVLDWQFGFLRAWMPRPAARDVVVVGVDEETLKRLPEPVTLWHRHLGRFLSGLAGAKPAVVGMDIVLPERSYDSVVPGADKLLMQGLLEARRSYPLVLAQTIDPAGKPRAIYPAFLTIAGPGASGYALFPVDGDGRVRRFDERLGEKGEVVPTLAGQMARRMGTDPQHGLIDFALGARFEHVPFHRVLEWLERGDPAPLVRAFEGKPVLLGMVLPFTDRLALPVALAAGEDNARDVPGVLLNAQALRSMLGPGMIKPVEMWPVALLAALAALLWFVTGHAIKLIAIYVAVAAGLLAGSTWLLAHGWFLPPSAVLLSGLLALSGRNGYETLLQLRERRRLRASFGGYVSPNVMQEILAGNIAPEPGGTQRFICVLFSDIRGYTTRSEAMTPEQVIRFLNRYFEEVVGCIHEHGGGVTSFIGDGIMAMFGAPNTLANPCENGFAAAREMLRYVDRLNKQLVADGEAPFEIGVGLHAGDAVIGHVGSSARHDYTAIGDAINVAARVEGLSKEAGYRLICSRAVAESVSDRAALVALGPMAIKGHTPVEVYGYDRIAG